MPEITEQDINEIYQALMMARQVGSTRISIDADTLEQLVVHWEQSHADVAHLDLDVETT